MTTGCTSEAVDAGHPQLLPPPFQARARPWGAAVPVRQGPGPELRQRGPCVGRLGQLTGRCALSNSRHDGGRIDPVAMALHDVEEMVDESGREQRRLEPESWQRGVYDVVVMPVDLDARILHVLDGVLRGILLGDRVGDLTDR